MTVYLVGAGPGDPGLLTRRAADLLARADVVVHDRLVDPGVLALASPHAELVDVGKRPGVSGRQERINELLVERGRRQRVVVRLKGGDPFVFGRGGEEAEALLAAGVPFEVVPGVTSALSAPAYAGVPVTHRGRATSVTIVTGHVDSTSPTSPHSPHFPTSPTSPASPASGAGGVDWASIARVGGTVVVLMGVEHRAAIADALMAGGRAADTPVVVVQWGTTARQRTVRTTLGALGGTELGSPATIVVGAVAGLDLRWFEARPLSGWTVVVTRPVDRGRSLAERLAEAGAEVVSLPVTATAPAADGGAALRRALAEGGHAWIALTSVNGVRAILGCMHDARDLAGTRLAAVGEATAAALAAHGIVADLVADDPSGAGLAAAMPPSPAGARGGGRVLHPKAAGGRPELAEGLRARGWVVDEVDAYRTVDLSPGDGIGLEALEAARRADAVVFAAPSAVRAFVAACGSGARPRWAVCIGRTTAEAAGGAGFETSVAPSADDDGLVAALTAIARGGGAAPPPAG